MTTFCAHFPPSELLPVTSSPITTRRTNCRKPLYRFSYGKDKITLATPCFEHGCNTCSLRQPAVGAFHDDNTSIISPCTTLACLTDEELLRHRQEACYRNVQEKLRKLSILHVRNAPPVKMRTKTVRAVKSGRVEKKKADMGDDTPKPQQRKTTSDKSGARFRNRLVLRFHGKTDASKMLSNDSENVENQQREKQLVVLKFQRHVEEFAKLSGEIEKKTAQLTQGQRLFLVIGKGDKLSCFWK
ncbi:hypothetical protein DBV05_g3672 [Lasiodiplodia theobromae]|uniref:Uncharacterized protein n=1 Tax=Lasiodiplodia theobromae TaxID=45133 RepID=A0A5N5DI52_9PEZI|nr:hypothetical protein DBV05_g3672 [Lasiodiplodia theobromae]